MTPVDIAAEVLADRGWSAGEISYYLGYTLTWHVYARRGDQTIITRGTTQSEAWQAAAMQSQQLEMKQQ